MHFSIFNFMSVIVCWWSLAPATSGMAYFDRQCSNFPQPSEFSTADQYVAEVLLLVRQENRPISNLHPGVEALVKVGADNVQVLLRGLSTSPGENLILIEALKRLVEERHAESVMDVLHSHEELISVIAFKGWTNRVRNLILEKISGGANASWLSAATQLSPALEPQIYETAFIHAEDKISAYIALACVPKLDWPQLFKHVFERDIRVTGKTGIDVAFAAAYFGSLDALTFLMSQIDQPTAWEKPGRFSPADVSTLLDCDAPMEFDALKKWFDQIKNELVYNPRRHMYEKKD